MDQPSSESELKIEKKPIHNFFSSKALTPEKLESMYQKIIRVPVNLDKFKKPRGTLYIIPERCKECNYCIEYCPEDVLELDNKMNSKGYHYPNYVDGKQTDCIACQMCTEICPEFAIFTVENK